MSQLIQLKQRIKAITSIKKITQTMRLISMSSHSKLKKQTDALHRFRSEVTPLLCALSDNTNISDSEAKPKHKNLFILFSAEKGLCGSFNNVMYHYFNHHLTPQTLENSHVISVGTKASQYLQQRSIFPLVEFNKVLPNKLEVIAQDLYEKIIQIHKNYESVICLSSHPKTFFNLEARATTLIPIQQDPCSLLNKINVDEYLWEQDRIAVKKSLFKVLLKINILLITTNSMISEQSARFLSMDNATRSAEDLLKTMKLAFNKMRQAKITRELIELIAGGF